MSREGAALVQPCEVMKGSKEAHGAAGGRSGLPQARFSALAPLVVLLALLTVPAARMAAESLEEVLAASRYAPRHSEAVRALFEEARSDGIPDELLLPRFKEGLAKKIPPARVQAVLRQNLRHLQEARALLAQTEAGPSLLADAAAWLRTANLLTAGVAPADIAAIASASRSRPGDYRQATALYMSAVDWGLEREEALGLTSAALASELPGESFAGLMETLAAGRRQRIAPEELLTRIREQLPHARSLEELQERVLYE